MLSAPQGFCAGVVETYRLPQVVVAGYGEKMTGDMLEADDVSGLEVCFTLISAGNQERRMQKSIHTARNMQYKLYGKLVHHRRL